MAAAGALTLMVGSGITKYLIGTDYNRGDLIPVDHVANAIIASTAFQANKNSLSIFQSCSSHANPITWKKYTEYFLDYAKTSPFEFQFSNPKITFLPDQKTYDVRIIKAV